MTERRKIRDRVPLDRKPRAPESELYRLFKSNDGARSRSVKWHHYFDIYENHFRRFRGDPVRILEIGVKAGGSLQLWADYFGASATVVGIDISPGSASFDGLAPNIHVRIGDQTDTGFLARVEAEFGPFDIVVDDGGHTARQQIVSFNFLYPEMSPNGVYVCEDTHTSYFPAYQDAGPGVTMVNYATQLVHDLHSIYSDEEILNTRFSIPPSDREGTVTVSRFAADTSSIHIYDSIVAFERRPRTEPYFEFG